MSRFLVMTAILAMSLAGTASAADKAAPSPNPRPTTIGGGVKNPWTSPYYVATGNPAPVGGACMVLGAFSMRFRRTAGKKQMVS
jgi:hypothetical protein